MVVVVLLQSAILLSLTAQPSSTHHISKVENFERRAASEELHN